MFRRFFRWLFSWRSVRAALFVVLILATLIALFYVVENWRGRFAWKKYRAAAERQGAQFDYQVFIPPPAPDEQNFAMTPLLTPMFDYVSGSHPIIWRDTNGWQRVASVSAYGGRGYDGLATIGDWTRGERTDLEAWQRFYRNEPSETNTTRGRISRKTASPKIRPEDVFPTTPQRQSPAADVLLALTKFNAEMSELELAAQRPHSRFPIHYNEDYFTLLPHLAKLHAFAIMFQLRASAQLAQTNGEMAFADLQTLFRFADAPKDEPCIISQAVRHRLILRGVQILWEGMSVHRWTEAQLAEVQRRLTALDLLSEMARSLHAERGLHILGLEHGLQNRKKYRELWVNALPGIQQPPFFDFYLRFAPAGWFYQNEIIFNRRLDEILDGIGKSKSGGIFAPISLPSRVQRKFYELPFDFPGDVLSNAVSQLPRMHTQLKLAQVACALERFHIAHRAYPQTLTELIPQFIAKLPHDFMDGQPLRFRRIEDYQFVLYSVGLDRKDDGGATPAKDNAPDGDWVWVIRSPVISPER